MGMHPPPTGQIVFIVICGLYLSSVSALQEFSVADQIERPQIMSARNSPMDTDIGEGPTRKKSRLEESTPSRQFPKTLEGFGYKFNEKGELRHATTGEPYVFEAEKGNAAYNQKRYEALGKVITEHVYKLLETETNLKKIHIPLDASKGEPRSFVFASENALQTKGKLLVLINGSGVVRAGQWARRLIINNCLDSGTQLPYIRQAMENGYEVLVLNTNENRALNSRGESMPVKGSSSPYEHGLYAWDHFIAKRPVQRVAIVAHSMGGSITAHIAEKREHSFLKKVRAIAFTDSVHNLGFSGVSHRIRKFFAKHSVNWVSSSKPLDTPVPLPSSSGPDSRQVSAGTKVHAETSWTSIQSVFVFLREQEEREMAAMRAGGGDGAQGKAAASLALSEEYDDDDDNEEKDGEEDDDSEGSETLELRGTADGDEGNGDEAPRDSLDGAGESQASLTGSMAGHDISPTEEDTEASFDFVRHSEEL